MRLQQPLVVDVTRESLAAEVAAQLDAGLRLGLVAGYQETDGFRLVYLLLGSAGQRVELVLRVPSDDAWVPSLAGISYPAGRFERELRDLFGIVPKDHPQPYRLVRHAHWPTGYHPLLRDAGRPDGFDADAGFPFVEVSGKGVYEIPVGPVHAGLIEPGHFRFSVVGETIVRMYQRLWFVHRGVEKLFEGRTIAEGLTLAERISGDTAVGHSLAYLMAVEDALGIEVGPRERLTRALLLECERLYNHVNDLGAIINDTGFAVLNAQAQVLRERLLRHNRRLTGHRLLRGALSLGGAELVESPDLELIADVASGVAELAAIATGHSLVANRLDTTAVLGRDDAARLGVLGYVARASGIAVDARVDQPFVELGSAFSPVLGETGDVRARFDVRAGEFAVSARLIADLTPRMLAAPFGLPAGEVDAVASGADAVVAQAGAGVGVGVGVVEAGVGVVEAWRGTLVHRVELSQGRLARVKVVDPSFFTWPGLGVALADVIVPDFPLANKSFNCSYAGNDL